MNILTETLPQTVTIRGKQYPINTDFRAGVSFEIMMQESTDNLLRAFELFFDVFPCEDINNITAEELEDITDAVLLFYCCGKTGEGKEKPTKKKQSYSFVDDSNAIFADFWNFYSIDLSCENLHWWAFRSLLEGLPEKSEFKQRIYYRTCDVKGLPKKEQKRILKIRSNIEIKKKQQSNKMSLDERNANMRAYIANRRKEIEGGAE